MSTNEDQESDQNSSNKLSTDLSIDLQSVEPTNSNNVGGMKVIQPSDEILASKQEALASAGSGTNNTNKLSSVNNSTLIDTDTSEGIENKSKSVISVVYNSDPQDTVIQSKSNKFKIRLTKLSKKTYALISIALIIVIAICGVSWIVFHKSNSSRPDNTTTTSELSSSTPGFTPIVKLSPATQARINAGLPPNQASSNLGIQYINIATNSSDTDNIVTADGNYLDEQTLTVPGGAYLGSLIYNGKTVYTDPNTSGSNEPSPGDFTGYAVLSQNGQHYGYTLNNGMYIDGKLVSSSDSLESSSNNPDSLIAVSNDGTSYIYGNSLGIYSSNNKQLANLNSLNQPNIFFDQDLSNFIYSDSATKAYYDGHSVNSDINVAGINIGISDNGQHYLAFGDNGVGNIIVQSSKKSSCWSGCVTDVGGGTGEDVVNDPPDHSYIINGTTTDIGYSELTVDGKNVYTSPKTVSRYSFKNSSTSNNESTGYSASNYNFLGNEAQSVSESVTYAGVNNNGDYYYILSPKNPYFVIDNEYYYPLSTKYFKGYGSSSTEESSPVATSFHDSQGDVTLAYTNNHEYAEVNDDVTHYIVGNPSSNLIDIDGRPTKLSGNVYNLELENNTLYVYTTTPSN